MESTARRRLSIFGVVFILIGLSGINISGAATKASVPSQPTNVKAVGGLESATLTWKVPASVGGRSISSYQVTYWPGPKVHICKSALTRCVVDIPNPNQRVAKPKPISYAFTIAATNSVGTGPASAKTPYVSVRFREYLDLSNTFRVPTAPPKPTPSPTAYVPAPLPYVTTLFDGSYAGQATVTLSPAGSNAGSTSTIATTFVVVNGRGAGHASNWSIDGYVTDPAGSAYVTVGDPTYGSMSFTVTFTQDPVTKLMSGNGRGTATFHAGAFGDITVDFVFNVSKGENQ